MEFLNSILTSHSFRTVDSQRSWFSSIFLMKICTMILSANGEIVSHARLVLGEITQICVIGERIANGVKFPDITWKTPDSHVLLIEILEG